MTENQPNREAGERARSLRKTQTISEGLPWSVLGGRQLCGLKFRRQHRIEPWVVDFACPQQRLVVKIDGGCHDGVVENDWDRQEHLESRGWKVIRFGDKEVEKDPEAVARAIAGELNLEYEFSARKATGPGMRSVKATKRPQK